MSTEYIELYFDKLLRVTDMAALFRYDDEEVWIPLSQISDEHRPTDDDVGSTPGNIDVAVWFAEKEGLA